MCFYLRNCQVTFLLYTLGVFISEYTAKAFTEPRDYRVVFLIQITGTLFNHSIPAIIHSERAGIRTPDNLIKSQVLYQLSYTPLFNYIPFNYKENAQSRNRTSDTRIFSPLLYQLSYLGLYTIYLCKLREQDLNLRPSGYEPDELPDCSIPRYEINYLY